MCRRRDSSKDITLALENSEPRGLWSDGDTMYVVDRMVQGWVFAYDISDLTVDIPPRYREAESFYLETNYQTQAWGIWSDHNHIFVSDSADKQFYAYDRLEKSRNTSEDRFARDNPLPVGFYVDGDTAYVASDQDQAGNKVWVYDWDELDDNENVKFTKNIILSHRTGAQSYPRPQGVYKFDQTLMVTDWLGDHMFAYNLTTGAVDNSQSITNMRSHGLTNPAGIWSDELTIWVADFDKDKLFAYNRLSEARVASRDIDLHPLNEEPRGIWSDGVYMYVVDRQVQGRVFAYEIGDLTRYNRLRPENDNPLGMWANEDAIFVGDASDRGIYAYYPEYLNVPRPIYDNVDPNISNEVSEWGGFWFNLDEHNFGKVFIVNGFTGPQIERFHASDRYSMLYEKTVASLLPLRTAATGLWGRPYPGGVIHYAVDNQGKRVLEYKVPHGEAAINLRSFDLGDDVEDPHGIWGNGAVMWVADDKESGPSQAYAYLMDDLDNLTYGMRLPDIGRGVRLARIADPRGLASDDGDRLLLVNGGSYPAIVAYPIQQIASR